MKTLLLVLIVPTLLLGCASIVAPGQTAKELEASGATRWAVTEYDFDGAHFVWVPHWAEGMLHVSTPRASNCKKLDVLELRGDVLVGRQELGSDRDKWAEVLKAHGRITPPAGASEASPLHLAVTERILHVGAPTEAVLFAAGFPSHGPNANPAVKRSGYEIKHDDVLYYLRTPGGAAQEVVLKGGKVAEIRDAAHLSKGWIPFYSTVR